MAKPLAPAALRRTTSSAFLPPLLLCALFCAALGAGVAAYLHRASAAATEEIYTRAEAVAAMAEHTLLRTFEAIQGVHDLLQLRQGLLEAEETPGTHAIQTHIKNTVAGGRFGIVQVGVANQKGVVTWGAGENAVGASVADREHVRAHLDGSADGLFVSHPLLGRTTGRWSIQVSRPVRDLWGRLVGVGVVSIDPMALSDGLGRDLNGAAQVALVRSLRDGAVLARSRDMEAWLGRQGFPAHPVVVAARSAPSGRIAYRGVTDGREVVGAYRVPEGLPLVVTVGFDLEHFAG